MSTIAFQKLVINLTLSIHNNVDVHLRTAIGGGEAEGPVGDPEELVRDLRRPEVERVACGSSFVLVVDALSLLLLLGVCLDFMPGAFKLKDIS